MACFVQEWPVFPRCSINQSVPRSLHVSNEENIFCVVFDKDLIIFDQKTSAVILHYERSEDSLMQYGMNIGSVLRADAKCIALLTAAGYFIALRFKSQTISSTNSPFGAEREAGELPIIDRDWAVESLTTIVVGIDVNCICMYGEHLFTTFKNGTVYILTWDGKPLGETATLSKTPFFHDVEHSRARKLSSPGIFCQAVEWAPTFGGVITILSSGDIALLRVLENSDGVWNLEGIWAECTENPVCLSVNNRFRTVAVGSENTEVSLYRLDETTGTVFVQQRLRVSNREYPDATTLVGPATKLAWSTDGYTLAVAWANCGWALWSVFGGLLHTSLGERVGLADRIKVSQMAWSANDCQLVTVMSFLSPKKNHSATLERLAAVEVENEGCDSEQHQCPTHIAVFQLARSALTTNPTSDNHHHLLLQASDRVLFSNRSQLTSTRSLQTLLVPALYMKHNWPLRYVAMNMEGDRIAVSGEHGFAHYSCVTKRWNMFGNEVQERSFKVCGGLVWWNKFICFGCFPVGQSSYQLRTYPSLERLDDQFVSTYSLIGSEEPLLVDTFDNLLTLLTNDGRVQVFRLSQPDVPTKKYQVIISVVQVIDLNNLILHPPCIVRLCLSSITANLPIPGDAVQKRQSKTDETTIAMDPNVSDHFSFPCSSDPANPTSNRVSRPCSLLLNYGGYLFLLQPSISSDAGTSGVRTDSNKKPLILTPFLIASNVELTWPATSSDVKIEEILPLTAPLSSTTDQHRLRPYLTDSLWLYCGALGLQVWLPLPHLHSISPQLSPVRHVPHAARLFSQISDPASSPLESHTHPMIHGRTHLSPGYISRRIMLSIELEEDVRPLAILFQEAVLVGVINEFHQPSVSIRDPDPSDLSTDFYSILPYGTSRVETHAFLHRLIQELLRKNLGAHALQLCSAYKELPHFHRLLEWLLHEVLETEATSKSPIPDPLLPQVVAFIQEFPQFLETIACCARKTEAARWPHLFAAVGRTPKDLFDLCIENNNLEAAASYLIILQASEPVALSHQCTLHLIEVAVDSSQWFVVRELMRFVNAIDPLDFKFPMDGSAMEPKHDTARAKDPRPEPYSVMNQRTTFFPDPKAPQSTRSDLLLASHAGNVEVEPVHSPRKPLSLSESDRSDTNAPILSSGIHQWLAHKVTELFTQGHLRQLAELVANFPVFCSSSAVHRSPDLLASWIASQRFDLHIVLDWPASLVQLHKEFNYPMPSASTQLLEHAVESTSALSSYHIGFSLHPSTSASATSTKALRQLRYLLSQLLQGGSFEWASLVALMVQDRTGLLEAVTLAVDASTRSTLSRLKDRHPTCHTSERRSSGLWRRVVGSQHQPIPSQTSNENSDQESGGPYSPLFGDPLSRVHAGLKQVDYWAIEHCSLYHQFIDELQPDLDQVVEQASSFFGQCASGTILNNAQSNYEQSRLVHSDIILNSFTLPDALTRRKEAKLYADGAHQMEPCLTTNWDGGLSDHTHSEHQSITLTAVDSQTDITLQDRATHASDISSVKYRSQILGMDGLTVSIPDYHESIHSKLGSSLRANGLPMNSTVSQQVILLPLSKEYEMESVADEYLVNGTEEISLRDSSKSQYTCVLS
ncbi:hypothetical protein CRM22_006432 [Opisthorchis felineus]|uniref:Protein RIC1 homolog n=1 Tax=Opisthorchis felineus TaxID=147828 RepID=A0A4S2LT79_OPIFE|nr:hypothetical protein CRM22_006432 [Opisthorchis felineus]